MNYSPLQLDIIRIFGKKNLSFGCIIKFNNENGFKKIVHFNKKFGTDKVFANLSELDGSYIFSTPTHKKDFEIIGHLPTLEDIFRVAKERKQPFDIVLYGYDDWQLKIYDCHCYKDEEKIIKGYNPTLSPLEQSEYTLEKLITLFK